MRFLEEVIGMDEFSKWAVIVLAVGSVITLSAKYLIG